MRRMRGTTGLVWAAVLILAACAPETKAPEIEAPVTEAPVTATPDRQESVPVTRVVTEHFYDDGSLSWNVGIVRPEAGALGDITVLGTGTERRAQFFAAKACIEDGGRFDTAVKPVTRDLPKTKTMSFFFAGMCQ